MDWYVRYTLHRNTRASEWASDALSPGHKAYALRQANMWKRLGLYAKGLFLKGPGIRVDVDFPPSVPEVKTEEPY